VLTVVSGSVDRDGSASSGSSSLIDEIVREGARRMLAEALQAGVDAYIARFADLRDDDGIDSVSTALVMSAPASASNRAAVIAQLRLLLNVAASSMYSNDRWGDNGAPMTPRHPGAKCTGYHNYRARRGNSVSGWIMVTVCHQKLKRNGDADPIGGSE